MNTITITNDGSVICNGKKAENEILLYLSYKVELEKGFTIIFDVYDNGTGMDKETRENLFTLFFSSKGNKGTGLGLFISNRIIQQHGGVIKVDTAPGKGSHFRIMLPKFLSESLKSPHIDDENNI